MTPASEIDPAELTDTELGDAIRHHDAQIVRLIGIQQAAQAGTREISGGSLNRVSAAIGTLKAKRWLLHREANRRKAEEKRRRQEERLKILGQTQNKELILQEERLRLREERLRLDREAKERTLAIRAKEAEAPQRFEDLRRAAEQVLSREDYQRVLSRAADFAMQRTLAAVKARKGEA